MEKGKRYKERFKLNKAIKYALIVIFTLLIVLGITYISIKIYTYNKEKNNYDELSSMIDNQIQEKDAPEKSDRVINLEKIHETNNDIIGWIQINDTNINYPVLQSDNSFYLNHNYKKEYSELGSIFMDESVNLELPSSNFLIYGHRNKRGMMFEDLMKYEDEEFYKKHQTIQFTTLKEDAEYQILAVFKSRVYYQNQKDVFRYYFFTNAETEEEYNNYVSNAKSVSLYDTKITAKYGEQLLTLSTCAYHTDNGRFVVVAKKSKIIE